MVPPLPSPSSRTHALPFIDVRKEESASHSPSIINRWSCLDSLITAGGWAFDLFLVCINLSDVVSDILIARQFWLAGQKTFFWLVFASLLLANVIYTLFGVEHWLRTVWVSNTRVPDASSIVLVRITSAMQYLGQCSRPIQFPIVFIFAQLMPVMVWLKEQLLPSQSSGISAQSRMAHWDGVFQLMVDPNEQVGASCDGADDTSTATRCYGTAVMDEEIGHMASTSHVLGRLEDAIERHFQSHAMLYAETVVESLPQCIVQLIAVSALGEASPLQVFSLATSLFSVVSKGYVFSRAFGVPEMVFKLLSGSVDVFALFFAVSSVASSMRMEEVSLLGSSEIRVDYLSLVWLLKILAFWGSIVLVCLVVLAVIAYKADWRRILGRIDLKSVLVGISYVSIGALLLTPAIVIAESVKMVSLSIWTTTIEPVANQWPRMTAWYAFCCRGGNWDAFAERIKYVSARFVSSESCRKRPRRKFGTLAAPTRTQHVVASIDPNSQDDPSQQQQQQLPPARRGGGDVRSRVWTDHRAVAITGMGSSEFAQFLSATPFRLWPFIRDSNHLKWAVCEPSGDRWIQVLICVVVAVWVTGAVYSAVVFPIAHMVVYWGHHNTLQIFCFCGYAASLAGMLLTAPAFSRHAVFLMATRFVCSKHPEFLKSGSELHRFIEEFFIPPPIAFLQEAIPHDLVASGPVQIPEVIASYLMRSDLDLRGISGQEFERLRSVMLSNEEFQWVQQASKVEGSDPPSS